MTATVSGYWPGITNEQRDLMPEFGDCGASYGNWMGSTSEIAKILKRLGLQPLMSNITYGLDEEDVDWVSPDELVAAADKLRGLVLAQDPQVKRVVDTYGLLPTDIDPIHVEFAEDLFTVGRIAAYAKKFGVPKMTLEVNW
jgi:hypothetical protein